MAVTTFRVENQKALRLAECLNVPRLMVICGANGAGKSTLLWALKSQVGMGLEGAPTDVLYQGPERAIRRQTVPRRYLNGALTSFADSLAANAVSAPEGLQIPYPSREPGNLDESGSAIKHTLGRLENRRQTLLTGLFDDAVAGGQANLDIANVPQIFSPLADVVERLLPHLKFEGVDFAAEDNIRVAFARTGSSTAPIPLDLDDLSSGEKAVILLFLPLVESQIRDSLDSLERQAEERPALPIHDRVFLLDEPELHLHPDLQRRMLAYMRERSSGAGTQFILITHSPTILDEAADEELFVLGPPAGTDNQLQKAASPSERLDALRELTGESYFLSTGRNLVCVEGEVGSVKGKLSDRSLIELLNHRSGRYTFIPMGGRSQVITAIGRLRESLPIERYGVTVVGLLDADRATTNIDRCVTWPFCEVENALLRPELIKDALVALEKEAPTDQIIDEIFGKAGEELRDDEIRLRISRTLGNTVIRPNGTDAASVRQAYEAALASIAQELAGSSIEDAIEAATSAVNNLLRSGDYIRQFRGKKLLRLVFRDLLLGNVSYQQFCYALAIAARGNEQVSSEIAQVFDDLDAEAGRQSAVLLATDETQGGSQPSTS